MRRIFIAGNWKMNKTIKEAESLISNLIKNLKNESTVEIAVFPPFTALYYARGLLNGSNIKLGAQDIYWKDSGAFTGEISAEMLKEAGCDYVIIGHSERRQYFSETDSSVNKKLRKAMESGLKPILCIGETLEERKADKTRQVLDMQIRGSLNGFKPDELKELVIAYEPVWAIGTGVTATSEQAEEAHNFIRNLLGELFTEYLKNTVRIQYGGSVKPDNISSLIQEPDIDGALVGGASLEADSFISIVINSNINKGK